MSAVIVAGNTSGSVSLTAPDVAGSTVITLPTTSGTMLLTNGNGSALTNLPTPTALSTASGSAPSYSARAWVNFNGTGTVAIRASGNVSSITDNGTGNYTINFTTAMSDASYAVTFGARQDADANENAYAMRVARNGIFSTTQVQVVHGYFAGGNVYSDCVYGLVSIFR